MILPSGAVFDSRHLKTYEMLKSLGVLEYVNTMKNCEEILLNFLISNSSRIGPVIIDVKGAVTGEIEKLSKKGLSSRGNSHYHQRDKCIGDFTSIFGNMPLRYFSYRKQNYISVTDINAMVPRLDEVQWYKGLPRGKAQLFKNAIKNKIRKFGLSDHSKQSKNSRANEEASIVMSKESNLLTSSKNVELLHNSVYENVSHRDGRGLISLLASGNNPLFSE
jgi:hypothetical protein